jgi:hypothetical protein
MTTNIGDPDESSIYHGGVSHLVIGVCRGCDASGRDFKHSPAATLAGLSCASPLSRAIERAETVNN